MSWTEEMNQRRNEIVVLGMKSPLAKKERDELDLLNDAYDEMLDEKRRVTEPRFTVADMEAAYQEGVVDRDFAGTIYGIWEKSRTKRKVDGDGKLCCDKCGRKFQYIEDHYHNWEDKGYCCRCFDEIIVDAIEDAYDDGYIGGGAAVAQSS